MRPRLVIPRMLVSSCLLAALLVPLLATPAAAAPPTPHHPGVWTTSQPWPGTTYASTVGVQAVHMAIARADTLYGRTHSQVLAFGPWDQRFNAGDGGLWMWKPQTDVGANAMQNLTPRTLAHPGLDLFCTSHAALPNGDLLFAGGHERLIAGYREAVRFVRESGTWAAVPSMSGRRWYGNLTGMGDGRVLASGGNKYDHMVVFGGRQQSGGTVRREIERYLFTLSGGWEPTLAPGAQPWPEAREDHTLSAKSGVRPVLFGGRDVNGTPLRDVWQLVRTDDNISVETYEWHQVTPGGDPIPARALHAAAVDKSSSLTTLYVHGGLDASNQPLDDLWRLVQTTGWAWTQVTTTGPAPSARSGHAAAWIEDEEMLVLFGGQGTGEPIDGAVHLLRRVGSAHTWSTPTLESGSPSPGPRAQHAMAMKPGFTKVASVDHVIGYVFGGITSSGALSDQLWELQIKRDGTSYRWVDKSASSTSISARKRASMVYYDAYPFTVVVIGGALASGAWDATVYEKELFDNQQQWRLRGAAPQALRGHAAIREPRELTEMQAEVYDPVASTWAAFGAPRYMFSYHMMFNGPDGKLYVPGPTFGGQASNLRLDPATGQWSNYGDGTLGHDSGTGAMLRPDLVMKCGGHFTDGSLPAPGTTATLQLGLASASWAASVNPMALGRRDHTVTVLPTGEAIATGGNSLGYRDVPLDAVPRLRPELFDPTHVSGAQRGWWYGANASDVNLLAEQPTPRSHHSSALLLPDGRILSAGGHDSHPESVKRSVDVYSPPYLFDSGSPALRPRLVGAQDHITWGQDFKVSCLDPVVSACLVRPGAATHTFNQDQRYVPLEVVSQVGNKVTLRWPAGSTNNHAPPGNYLLFVLSQGVESRVPSIARWVNVGAAATSFATWDTLPPTQTIDLGVFATTPTGSTVTYTLSWSAPGDQGEGSVNRAARYELRYRAVQSIATLDDFFDHGTRVLSPPTPGTSGAAQFVDVPGLDPNLTYHFRLISRDDADSDRNWSVMSNEATQHAGGGCPFAWTLTASGWQVENSILSRSLTGTASLDDYRLRHAPLVEAGRMRLSIREDEQEHTTLDRVRLVAVDHAPGLEAHSVGEHVRLGMRTPVHRVRSSLAGDLTHRFVAGGGGHTTASGETLWVDLTAPPAAGASSDPRAPGALGAVGTNPGGGGVHRRRRRQGGRARREPQDGRRRTRPRRAAVGRCVGDTAQRHPGRGARRRGRLAIGGAALSARARRRAAARLAAHRHAAAGGAGSAPYRHSGAVPLRERRHRGRQAAAATGRALITRRSDRRARLGGQPHHDALAWRARRARVRGAAARGGPRARVVLALTRRLQRRSARRSATGRRGRRALAGARARGRPPEPRRGRHARGVHAAARGRGETRGARRARAARGPVGAGLARGRRARGGVGRTRRERGTTCSRPLRAAAALQRRDPTRARGGGAVSD